MTERRATKCGNNAITIRGEQEAIKERVEKGVKKGELETDYGEKMDHE